MSDILTIGQGDGAFEGYLALPRISNGMGIVLLGEVYNANHFIRGVADRYAAQGYTVLAPDLYWRLEPGQYLDYTPEGQRKARELKARLDVGLAVADIDVAAQALLGQPGVRTAGVLGFCLGGQLAFAAGARAEHIGAACGYYPIELQHHFHDAETLRVPTLVHFAELDERTPPDLIAAIRERAAPRGATIHVYANALHGFGRVGYPPFKEDAAALAEQRSLDFFRTALS